ncbi:MAG TPA: YeeE/YedE thiosulfate transporter family protein [Candidatus Brocadiia bacterium]|nr:YeeE/YedE thiosulfate transporter family protein [Candidatus Brocadiia bacterium]
MDSEKPHPVSNPYLAGVMLGLTLLASFLFLGVGLGASAGIARFAAFAEGCVAPRHVASSEYFGAWGSNPLSYYLVVMMAGTFFGGLFSALLANRMKMRVEKGVSCSRGRRMSLALVGGIIVGFASRLAGGCTSGQALTGGALLLTGSLIFLICLFAGGYAAAYPLRRQWHD